MCVVAGAGVEGGEGDGVVGGGYLGDADGVGVVGVLGAPCRDGFLGGGGGRGGPQHFVVGGGGAGEGGGVGVVGDCLGRRRGGGGVFLAVGFWAHEGEEAALFGGLGFQEGLFVVEEFADALLFEVPFIAGGCRAFDVAVEVGVVALAGAV